MQLNKNFRISFLKFLGYNCCCRLLIPCPMISIVRVQFNYKYQPFISLKKVSENYNLPKGLGFSQISNICFPPPDPLQLFDISSKLKITSHLQHSTAIT